MGSDSELRKKKRHFRTGLFVGAEFKNPEKFLVKKCKEKCLLPLPYRHRKAFCCLLVELLLHREVAETQITS